MIQKNLYDFVPTFHCHPLHCTQVSIHSQPFVTSQTIILSIFVSLHSDGHYMGYRNVFYSLFPAFLLRSTNNVVSPGPGPRPASSLLNEQLIA